MDKQVRDFYDDDEIQSYFEDDYDEDDFVEDDFVSLLED